jgi:hypothetical protein
MLEITLYTNEQVLKELKNHRSDLNYLISSAKDYSGNGWNIPIKILIGEEK